MINKLRFGIVVLFLLSIGFTYWISAFITTPDKVYFEPADDWVPKSYAQGWATGYLDAEASFFSIYPDGNVRIVLNVVDAPITLEPNTSIKNSYFLALPQMEVVQLGNNTKDEQVEITGTYIYKPYIDEGYLGNSITYKVELFRDEGRIKLLLVPDK